LGAVGAAIVLFSGTAGAALSHLGPTGVVGTPTAELTADGYYDVALDYIDRDMGGTSLEEWPLRLTVGIREKAELGTSYLRLRNGESLRIVGLNGKAILSRETDSMPALVVGVVYGDSDNFDFGILVPSLVGNVGDMTVTTVYLVATKTLIAPETEYGFYEEIAPTGNVIRGSLGVMYNRYEFEAPGLDQTDSETKPFVSLELIAPGGTAVAIEYKSKEKTISADPISSVVLRHRFAPGFWTQLGLTNAVHTVADDAHEFFFGIQYRWGAVEEDEYF